MLFQINNPEGISEGILSIQVDNITCGDTFEDTLYQRATEIYYSWEGGGQDTFMDALINDLSSVGITADRIFITEINI